MANEVGSSNQTPDKPVTLKERIKLFFTLHTILAFLIFIGGTTLLFLNIDIMSPAGFWFWFTLISVITTLLIGVWFRDKKNKTY